MHGSVGRPGAGGVAVSRIAWTVALMVLATAGSALAHDTWVITHDQEDTAHAMSPPEIFTSLGIANVTISLIALIGVVGWIGIGRTDIPDRVAARLNLPRVDAARLEPWVPLALRLGLAAMFVTAAFGLHPRLGHAIGESPVLFASDLEFRHLPGDWTWLVWGQVALGAAFLLGVWTRVASILLAALVLLGCWLFTVDMLAYAGVLIGTAYYLLVKGGGAFRAPRGSRWPGPPGGVRPARAPPGRSSRSHGAQLSVSRDPLQVPAPHISARRYRVL